MFYLFHRPPPRSTPPSALFPDTPPFRSLAEAQRMMPSWYIPPSYRAPTGLAIVAQVARVHGYSVSDLTGPSKRRPVCIVRWRAMKALQETGCSIRSEEHTSELQSLMRISYAVFCLKKKKRNKITQHNKQQ